MNKEIILAFLDKRTIEKAKEQFNSGAKIVSIESSDFTFRLFKGADNIICFEFLVLYEFGKEEQSDLIEMDISGVKPSEIRKVQQFFSPIGFFQINKYSLSGYFDAFILKQFESDYDILLSQNKIISDVSVKKLTLKENGIIGAFSAEAAIHLLEDKECNFQANGLHYRIVMAHDGDPQIFLDRKNYDDGDPCMAVYLQSQKTLCCNAEHGEIDEKFWDKNIYSCNKFI